MNQFFYTIEVPKAEGSEETVKVMASFALNRVVRTVEYGKGLLRVALDDFHTETRFVNNNKNGGKSQKREDINIHSQIDLNMEDTERFIKIAAYSLPLNKGDKKEQTSARKGEVGSTSL